MLAVDVHQHVWPDTLLRALERRTSPPSARWHDGVWEITLAHEPAFTVAAGVEERGDAVAAAGLDRAIVALSAPAGIEALPPREAEPLLAAWADTTLPASLEAWATLALHDPDPAPVSAALDAGAAGLCLPAGALSSAAALERLGPVLALLEQRLAPLFVHPGAPQAPSAVAWWAPATDYVAQLHAAWHAFSAWGRPAHPRLHVVFAALAGLAPLHTDRTAARGGPVAAQPDPLIFYEPSSYGAWALRAMAGAVGVAQLVHGSDEPVIDAPQTRPLGPDVHDTMRTSNVARLLGREWSAA